MRIRIYLFWLIILIVILLLIWQLMLIMVTMNDLLGGIDLYSFDIELNKSKEIIPHEIHQMWKTNDLSTYPINNSS